MLITIDIMQKSLMNEHPEGIIITVGEKMYGHHGYKVWLTNFLDCMKRSEDLDERYIYHFRQGNQPKMQDSLRFVYLCIGGRIRYRVLFAGCYGEKTLTLNTTDGKGIKTLHGKAWVMVAGPAERAPFKLERTGFQGFRYTERLF